MLAISLTIACSRYINYGVILHAHPVRGESHNQLNTTGEVATVATEVYICKQSMISCSATAALVPDLKITPIRGHL